MARLRGHDRLPLRAVTETRHKSLLRVWGNHVFAEWRNDISGVVLDLASGQGASYRSVWSSQPDPIAHIINVDLEVTRRPHVVADLQRSLPFAPGVVDAVVLSWFLYIVLRPADVLQHVQEVLRPGGALLMTVPLVFPVTAEPTDYWRFTDQGVDAVLRQAGFDSIEIVPLGGRWSAAVNLVDPFLRPRAVAAPVAYGAAMLLDRLSRRFAPRLPTCPMGYAVRARKVVDGGSLG